MLLKKSYELLCLFNEWNKYLTPSQNMTWYLLAISEVIRLFLVVGHRFAHISGGVLSHFSLQILSESLRFRVWRTFSSLHRLSIRLARPLQDLNVLLLEPVLCCLGRVFWVIVMLGYPPHDPFSMSWRWRYIVPFMPLTCRVPFSRRTPPKLMFPPPCLTVLMVFLGSFLLLLRLTVI